MWYIYKIFYSSALENVVLGTHSQSVFFFFSPHMVTMEICALQEQKMFEFSKFSHSFQFSLLYC